MSNTDSADAGGGRLRILISDAKKWAAKPQMSYQEFVAGALADEVERLQAEVEYLGGERGRLTAIVEAAGERIGDLEDQLDGYMP